MAYVFSDLKYLVQSQVLSKVHKHLHSTMFLENTIDRITKTTKRTLRQVFTEFDASFHRQLTEAQALSTKTLYKRDQLSRKQKRLTDIYEQCKELKFKIEDLAIDLT